MLRSPFHFDSALPLSEFIVSEELSLSEIHRAVLTFLRGREDVVVFGAQAVNVYVSPPRMTQNIDLMSETAQALSEEVRHFLHEHCQIAARVRQVASGKGYRVYQLRTPSNRHLVDVRQVDGFPTTQTVEGLRIVQPAALIALKVMSIAARPDTPKGLTDQADLMRLLLTYPELQTFTSEVQTELDQLKAPEFAMTTWQTWVNKKIHPDLDDY